MATVVERLLVLATSTPTKEVRGQLQRREVRTNTQTSLPNNTSQDGGLLENRIQIFVASCMIQYTAWIPGSFNSALRLQYFQFHFRILW